MCKLVADKSKIAGTTLHTEGRDCIRQSAVYYPPAHTSANTDLTVILWLHGWYVNDAPDIFIGSGGETKLRESALASTKDVVLVAPFLGHKWATKERDPKFPDDPKKKISVTHGSLGLSNLAKDNGVEKYLDEVLALLKPLHNDTQPTIKNLVIACHSGGGDLMRAATGALGKHLSVLKECWGYDCMYAMGETYGCWADSLPSVTHFFYLADGSSAVHFAEFWKFAFGSPQQNEPQPMNNLFLAPAIRGIENLTDQIVFQTPADIQGKVAKGTPLISFEELRKKADPLVDDGKQYAAALNGKLTGHFPVVQDVFRPRIERFGAKLASTRIISQLRQAACHPLPPPPKKKVEKGGR